MECVHKLLQMCDVDVMDGGDSRICDLACGNALIIAIQARKWNIANELVEHGASMNLLTSGNSHLSNYSFQFSKYPSFTSHL